VLREQPWEASELFARINAADSILPSLEQYCAELSTELSGVQVSQRMFRRLGGMWLLHLVHQISAMEDVGVSNIELASLTIPFESWTHHSRFVSTESYRNQMRSLVQSADQGTLRDIKTASTDFLPATSMSNIRQRLEHFVQGLSHHERSVTVVRPYLKVSAVDRTLAILRSRNICTWNDFETALEPKVSPNIKARLALVQTQRSGDLESVVRTILPLVLPVGYAEGLAELQNELESATRRTKALYSANASQFHLPYQVLSASWGERGTRVLSHQHGGHQGLDEVCAAENYEARASDRHYTLGWTDTRPSLKVLPSAMPQKSRGFTKQRLLLMSVTSTKVVYRLQPFCMPSHVQRCAIETRIFVSELVWPTLPIVRCSTSDIETLKLTGSVLYEGFAEVGTVSASKSSLVVHNYFGVSWLETLAMNIPTVCFVPAGIHRFRVTAQPFIDALARVGVIHYTGKEAAKFVNSLRGEPSTWWKSAEVQEAREAFVARYANFSDNWLEAWQEEFETLLAE
jgi:putative transferase (TIGR04331 family)